MGSHTPVGDPLPVNTRGYNRRTPMTSILAASLVYERFTALNQLAAQHLDGLLGGRLLVYGPVDDYGSACALAGNIAGAATLGLDADGEELKQAIRNGVCDFMVNSLDEALRILKNEVRKKLPVSVCLRQDRVTALQELTSRGVQPDVLAFANEELKDDVAALMERGALVLPPEAGMAAGKTGISWSVDDFPALWLPKVDALAAQVCGDALRSRWLRLAPRYLGRRAHSLRYVIMTTTEAEEFGRVLQKEINSGAIQTAVRLRQNDSEVTIAAHT